MSLKATNENLPPTVIRQLAKELKNLDDSPPEGIKVIVNDEDFTTIFADIEGPGKILWDALLCTLHHFVLCSTINFVLMPVMLWYFLNAVLVRSCLSVTFYSELTI
jgi:hypothetical protein